MSKHAVEEFINAVLDFDEVGMVDNADVELYVSANTFQGQLVPFKRRVLVSDTPVAIDNEIFIWVKPSTRAAYLSDIDSQSFVQVAEFNELFAHVSDFFNTSTSTPPAGAVVPAGSKDDRWRVSKFQIVQDKSMCTDGFCVVKSDRTLYGWTGSMYAPMTSAVLVLGNTE